LVFYYLSRQPGCRVAGFTVDPGYFSGETLCGLKVVPFNEIERFFPPTDYDMLVSVGYSQVNAVRARKCLEAKEKGYRLASFIHPTSVLWEGFLPGENSIFFEENVFQPFSKIGNNLCVWAGCLISHHAELGDNVYLAPGVVISGGAKIGNNTFIGSNATIRDNVNIGKNCVIGAGAVILHDVGDNEVYAGPEPRLLAIKSYELKNI
jgi:sugar O-acyltransferase (sialic acid O-acetyltransferase NeuD family)